MKKLAATSALGAAVLAALVLLYSWSQAHERTVMSWSNGLVWWALGSAATPLYSNQSVSKGSKSGQWVVRGAVQIVEDEGGLSAAMPYEALVEQRCPVPNDPLCWHLEDLVVENVRIDVTRLAGRTRSEMAGTKESRIAVNPDQPAESGSAQDPMPKEPPTLSTGSPEPPALSGKVSETANETENDQSEEFPGGVDEPAATEALVSRSEQEAKLAGEPVQISNRQASSTHAPRDERSLVMEIQRQLTQEGFETGPIDGVFGPRTSRAIAAYQAATGRPVDGLSSEELLNHLLRRAQDR